MQYIYVEPTVYVEQHLCFYNQEGLVRLLNCITIKLAPPRFSSHPLISSFISRTFGYVQKEIIKIPDDIPVLVLGNHCDMSHHRTIVADSVQYYIDSIQRLVTCC